MPDPTPPTAATAKTPVVSLPAHPGLTITTYRVHPDGTSTTPETRHLAPSPVPLHTSIWPPCGCPRHARRATL